MGELLTVLQLLKGCSKWASYVVNTGTGVGRVGQMGELLTVLQLLKGCSK